MFPFIKQLIDKEKNNIFNFLAKFLSYSTTVSDKVLLSSFKNIVGKKTTHICSFNMFVYAMYNFKTCLIKTAHSNSDKTIAHSHYHYYYFVVVHVKPRSLHMLGKPSTTKLFPSPSSVTFKCCRTFSSNTYHKSVQISYSSLLRISCIIHSICQMYVLKGIMLFKNNLTQN
jgi:hypothetical protein